MRKGISVFFLVISLYMVGCSKSEVEEAIISEPASDSLYVPPDTSTIPSNEYGAVVRYGKELLLNFPYYLGPKGTVGHFGNNGLSCQNCHLESGTRPYGLNFFSAHARYPQYRAREGRVLTLADRINNCIERPLNGRSMPLDSKEMVAMVTYMQWLGKNVPVGGHVPGDKLKDIELMDRPADSKRGLLVYQKHCVRCHLDEGQGVLKEDGIAYVYPPLWGPLSYQPGSSMHRLIKAAQFIKYNMPWDLVKWNNPILTDEEALDVAAYVNDDKLHTRPTPPMDAEYPNHKQKPVDYYYPPYVDGFSQEQHKYGPFKPIIKWRKANGHPTGY